MIDFIANIPDWIKMVGSVVIIYGLIAFFGYIDDDIPDLSVGE